jgi:hypothetical protein
MAQRQPTLVPQAVRRWNIRLDACLRHHWDNVNLRKWKLARAGVVTVAVFAFATYAIAEGAEPTTTALFALVMVALLNGIDLAELLSVWAEVRLNGNDEGDE